MNRIAIIVVTIVTVALTANAMAQGSKKERDACHGDAVKFCKYALGGGPFSVGPCLMAVNRAKLSPQCRAVLAAHGV